jgi:hypothetical protein
MRRSMAIGAMALCLLIQTAAPASAAWSVKVIADRGPSPTSSLVISQSGGAFDAWLGRGGDDLYWAKMSASGWTSTIVAGEGDFFACYSSTYDGVGPSAALLPNGTPEIASACDSVNGGGNVMYTKRTATGWTTTVVGIGPSDECRTSPTDVDLINNPTTGRPVIVMMNQCTAEITGFYSTGTTWVKRVMSPGAGVGTVRFPAMDLAVDPTSGNLALAGVADVFGRESLFLSEFSWDLTHVDYSAFSLPNGDAPYAAPSLAFLPDGTGYLAFEEGTPYGTAASSAYGFLALATRTGGTWGAPAVVDHAAKETGADPSLSLVGGTLHIAYQDVTHGNLRYATSVNGAAWTRKTVTAPHDTGYHPSLGVTIAGKVRIAGYDATTGSLVGTTGP